MVTINQNGFSLDDGKYKKKLGIRPILYLGPRLSKEATDFAGESDSVLILESPDCVNEHLRCIIKA